MEEGRGGGGGSGGGGEEEEEEEEVAHDTPHHTPHTHHLRLIELDNLTILILILPRTKPQPRLLLHPPHDVLHNTGISNLDHNVR